MKILHASTPAAKRSRLPADNGHDQSPGSRQTRRPRKTAVLPRQAVAQPRYDQGLRFDTPGLRYAAEDPVPAPTPEGAKVRLELGRRSDTDLAGFAEAHVLAMAGNANFPDPTPTPVDFAQALADFEAQLSVLENIRLETKRQLELKDQARARLSALFTQRGQYVEVAANGNAEVILTSGLPVRRTPTPVGQLPWPLGLEVMQSQVVGELIVRWKAVSSARGYLVQCAEVVADKPREWANVYTGGKLTSAQKPLTPGKTYEFRAAALGGSTGQSEFSPVVSRMAA